MIEELNKTRFDTKELGLIDSHFYENIFSVYKKDKHFIYNIKKRVTLPEGIVEDQFFYYKPITINAPWTLLSFHHYGTIKLWWLICVCNNITNPVYNCEPGMGIRFLKPQYISDVIREIRKNADR